MPSVFSGIEPVCRVFLGNLIGFYSKCYQCTCGLNNVFFYFTFSQCLKEECRSITHINVYLANMASRTPKR